MKISVVISAGAWFASLNDADHAEKAAALLKSELNAVIDDADRRLALPGASRGLQRARDQAARAIGAPASATLIFELEGARILAPQIALTPMLELRDELARDALRTFKAPAREVSQENSPTKEVSK